MHMSISKETEATPAADSGTEAEDPALVVLDIGKRKKKQIKRLRKGRGKLLRRIDEAVEGLKADGLVQSDAQTVVVVVEAKERGWRWY
jgi:hypothetical protein